MPGRRSRGPRSRPTCCAGAGYDAWNWSDRALLRATRFLYARAGWAADGDDEWQPWLIDRRYGTAYRGAGPGPVGKNFGYTDWLYAP